MTATKSNETLTTQQIRNRVQELGDWFHNLDLAGVETAPDHFLGDYPEIKWRRFSAAIPADLRGKSVLDIGCNAGFYSIQMKRRGAERVLAIDTDETGLSWSDSERPNYEAWFDRMMKALEPFEVTLTFCFTPESKGINPHHTSAPRHIEEYADFCGKMVQRYT